MAMRPAPHFVVSQTRQPLLNSVLQILCACCARDFWTRVNRLKHTGKLVSSTIHCCNDNIEIANVLLTSSCVGLDGSQTRLLKQEIDERLSNASLANDCVISSNEVCAAAKYLKCNKRDGFGGLTSDYVINACEELFIHIACLFSSLVVHGAGQYFCSYPKSKNIRLLI